MNQPALYVTCHFVRSIFLNFLEKGPEYYGLDIQYSSLKRNKAK